MELVVVFAAYLAFGVWLGRTLKRRRREQRARTTFYEAQVRRRTNRRTGGWDNADGPYDGPQAA